MEVSHWGVLGDKYVCHTGVFRYASLSLFPTHKEAKNNLYHTFLPPWFSAPAHEAKRGPRVSESWNWEPKQIFPLLFLSGILVAMQKQLRQRNSQSWGVPGLKNNWLCTSNSGLCSPGAQLYPFISVSVIMCSWPKAVRRSNGFISASSSRSHPSLREVQAHTQAGAWSRNWPEGVEECNSLDCSSTPGQPAFLYNSRLPAWGWARPSRVNQSTVRTVPPQIWPLANLVRECPRNPSVEILSFHGTSCLCQIDNKI